MRLKTQNKGKQGGIKNYHRKNLHFKAHRGMEKGGQNGERIIWGLIIVVWLILCFVVAFSWEAKGLSYSKGFAISFFFSPVIGILMGIFESIGFSKIPTDSKECPDCGETIKLDARICRFCGHKFKVNYLELAKEYKKKGEILEAIGLYKKHLKLNPNDSDAYNNLGLLYYGEEEYEKALENYKKAIEIDPNDGVVYYNMGFTYEGLEENIKAIEAFERYKELEPEADDISKIDKKILLLKEV